MDNHARSKPDEILDAAEKLFSTKAFHEVRLEDVAALARVGKGTVYLYWSSKEDVYLAIIRRGFAAVLADLETRLPADSGAWPKLEAVVRALVDFAFSHPGVYQIMRSGAVTPEDAELIQMRRRLADQINSILHEGIRDGEIDDPFPALTTQFIFSFVRGAMLYPPDGLTAPDLCGHIMRVLRSGIRSPG
jgi:AcrR family transcriptional regulator